MGARSRTLYSAVVVAGTAVDARFANEPWPPSPMMLPRTHYRLVRSVAGKLAAAGVEPHSPVLAAVSGGSDSTALLELLALARKKEGGRLGAAYIDHGIRAQAAHEARLVAATAEAVGADYHGVILAHPGYRDEARLRAMRYEALDSLALERGYDWIATGHTRDDQIETIIFRFFRGGGRLGLSGIPARRGRIVRPLLDCTRKELRDFLGQRGRAWVEDSTNELLDYSRNRIRLQLIPELVETFGDGWLEHLPALAARWLAEERYLEEQAARYASFCIRRDAFDLVALERAPAELRGRILKRWLESVIEGASIEIAQLERVEDLATAREGSAEVVVAGARVVREYHRLFIRPTRTGEGPLDANARGVAYAVRVDPLATALIRSPDGGWEIEVRASAADAAGMAASVYFEQIELHLQAAGHALLVRPARAGDVVDGSRRGGRSKVFDLLTDRKVPRRLRPSWPVLAAGDEVLWVPGVAVAASAVQAGPRSRSVRMAWRMTVR